MLYLCSPPINSISLGKKWMCPICVHTPRDTYWRKFKKHGWSIIALLQTILTGNTIDSICLCWIYVVSFKRDELGSSVSIVSGYGLDDRATAVRFPAEAKVSFLLPLCSHRLWGSPSRLYNEYLGSLAGAKARKRRDADHLHPSSAEVEN
jgi:hypothetical protein